MKNTPKRLALWALIVALLLMIPLVLTLLGSGVDGDGWHWTLLDFVFMGALLFGGGAVYELATRKMENRVHQIATLIVVVAAVLLIWIQAAVGIW